MIHMDAWSFHVTTFSLAGKTPYGVTFSIAKINVEADTTLLFCAYLDAMNLEHTTHRLRKKGPFREAKDDRRMLSWNLGRIQKPSKNMVASLYI
jgi:hypothetical protein